MTTSSERHEQITGGASEASSGIWTETFRAHSYEVDFKKASTLESLCHHFQEAAWNHAEALRVGYQSLLQQDRLWVLSRLAIKVTRYPIWGETMTLHTWPRASKSVFAMRDFEIFDSAQQILVAGSSAWLALDLNNRKPQRVDKLISKVQLPVSRRALESDPEAVTGCDFVGPAITAGVHYSDIDVNGHVNNVRYIRWLMDSYPLDFHRSHEATSLEINYLGETHAGKTISIATLEKLSDQYLHSITDNSTGKEVCRARIIWRSQIHDSKS